MSAHLLYNFPLAFHPVKPVLLAHEKSLISKGVVRVQTLNILGVEGLRPQFMRVNPASTVPVLVKPGGEVIAESLDIVRYLDSFDGQPLGGDRVDRALADRLTQELGSWDGNLYAAAHLPPSTKSLINSLGDYRIKFMQARMAENPDLKAAYEKKIASSKAARSAGEDPQKVKQNQEELTRLLDHAEACLSKAAAAGSQGDGPFLAGPAMSTADIMLGAVIQRIFSLGRYEAEIASRPALREYTRRLRARPAWKATFATADSTWGKLSLSLPAILKAKIYGALGLY